MKDGQVKIMEKSTSYLTIVFLNTYHREKRKKQGLQILV
jgi:hypothetical protein